MNPNQTPNQITGNRGGKLTRFRLPALVVAVILVTVGTLAMVKRGNSKVEEKPAAPAVLEFAAADVTRVEQLELVLAIPLSGSLAPVVQSTVKAKVSGELLKVLVREGEQVKQGQVLAEVDTGDLRARLDGQLAISEEARARWQIAAKNRDNNLKLLRQNFISQNAFDTTQSTYDATVATVKSAEAQTRIARNALNDAIIHAPIAGIVAKKMVNAGEKINPESALFLLVDLARMEITAAVPATEISGVKVGQAAHFEVDGFGKRVFEGRVERINPMTEQGSRSISLYLSVANTDGALKGGMFAKGALILAKTAPAPVIPLAAVHEEAGESYVLTLDAGRIARHAVTLGLRDEQSGMVEVRSGLSPGAQLVNSRLEGLRPGVEAVVKMPAGEVKTTEAKKS